jgi:AhpD family alkylhydroperoxidase
VFVVDTDDKELTIPVNKATSRSKKVSKRLDYNQVASVGIKALGGVCGYVMQSSLPTVLVNLVYLRVSQMNNCAYCLDTHTRLSQERAEHRKDRASAGLSGSR